MNISILISHFKTGKMTAYTIYKILEHSANHNIEILVCDNNARDGSIEYLSPFKDKIKIFEYPKNIIQSHGIGYNYLLPYVNNEYFITLESDSYPIKNGWLDYYKLFIDNDYDIAGSLLQLSGGKYIHVAGALYKKSLWHEANLYCHSLPYHYLSNFGYYEGFDCHVMVHDDIWRFFLEKPSAFVKLPDSKKDYNTEQILQNEHYYHPVVGPFHNGMGMTQETVNMIGARNPVTDPKQIILNGRDKIIHRVGYEPGQWLTYWAIAKGKKICEIPTETVWMPNRENQQQEYTLTENGVKHAWGVSSFAFSDKEDIQDIAVRKKKLPEELYETLPEEYKIKMPQQGQQQFQ